MVTLHYTYLAIQEGYTVTLQIVSIKIQAVNVVANSLMFGKKLLYLQVLADYTTKKRKKEMNLSRIMQHSIVIGFDYYYYTKSLLVTQLG